MQNSAGMDSLEGMKDNVSSYLGSPGRTSSSSSFVHSGNVSELVIHRIDLDSSSPHTLEKLLEIPSGSYLVIDEIRQTSWNIISWLLKHCNPKSLWCAGQYGEDPPPTFEKHLLKQIIRCPPMVQRVLKRAEPELGNVKTEWFETRYKIFLKLHPDYRCRCRMQYGKCIVPYVIWNNYKMMIIARIVCLITYTYTFSNSHLCSCRYLCLGLCLNDFFHYFF